VKIDYIIENVNSGRGWFKVSPEQQRSLGVSEGSFSPYSFIESDGTIYAEEDCDWSHVFRAAVSKGIKLNINYVMVNGHSWVRTLPRCSGDLTRWFAMSETLPTFYQRLTLSKEDALKLATETHVISGIVDGTVRIKPKEEDCE